MPEDDQTRWIGVRPTNPPENIPVTESAPLTSILIEPVAGCDPFPITFNGEVIHIIIDP